jgi:hypothetical protein
MIYEKIPFFDNLSVELIKHSLTSILPDLPKLIRTYSGNPYPDIDEDIGKIALGIYLISQANNSKPLLQAQIKNFDYEGAFETLAKLAPRSELETRATSDKCRERYVNKYSFSILHKEPIIELQQFLVHLGIKNVLEIGCGYGLWASLLGSDIQANGEYPQIIATDGFSSHGSEIMTSEQTFTDVIRMDGLDAIETFPTEALFLCWPIYESTYNTPEEHHHALNWLKAFKGEYLILISNDVCASEEFYELLYKEWGLLKKIEKESWYCIWDSIQVFQRKKNSIVVELVNPTQQPITVESINQAVESINQAVESTNQAVESINQEVESINQAYDQRKIRRQRRIDASKEHIKGQIQSRDIAQKIPESKITNELLDNDNWTVVKKKPVTKKKMSS